MKIKVNTGKEALRKAEIAGMAKVNGRYVHADPLRGNNDSRTCKSRSQNSGRTCLPLQRRENVR